MWNDPLHIGADMIEIICGACDWKTANLNLLHIHLTSHTEGGNYMYHHAAKTAFPVNHLVSSSTQTEASLLVHNATQTDESDFKSSKLQFDSIKLESGASGYDTTKLFSNNDDQHSLGDYGREPIAVKTEADIPIDIDVDDLSLDNDAALELESSNSDTERRNKNTVLQTKSRQRNVKGATKRKRKVPSKKSKRTVNKKIKVENDPGDASSGTDNYFEENDDKPLSSLIKNKSEAGIDLLEDNVKTDLPEGDVNNQDQGDKAHGKAKVKKKRIRKKISKSYKTVVYDPPSLFLQCHICHTQCKLRSSMYHHIESKHAGQYYWKCTFCRVPFVAEGDYLHHTKQCKDSWVKCHTCSECNHQRVFISKKQLLEHLKQSHDNVFPLSCSVCNVPIASEFDEREHMSEHNKEILKCRFCETVSKSIVESEIHMASHLRDNPFTCFICDKAFNAFVAVQGHVYTHLDDDGGDGSYVCEICGASFTHSRKRFDHWRRCRKRYKCETCGKPFPSQYHLTQHEGTHDETKKHFCDQCGESFSYRYALNLHVKMTHDEDYTAVCFKCGICGNIFRSKKSLDGHLLIHKNLRPYSCKHCGRDFRAKTALKTHIRQHTGEKPYACTKCGLTFTQNVSRRNHEAKCKVDLPPSMVAVHT